MFLSVLNQKERLYFCSLLQHVANCDNDFSVVEKAIIDEYKRELDIESMEPAVASLDEIIVFFAKSAEKVRHAVFIEAVSFILSDGRYENCERSIVDGMARAFKISDDRKLKYLEKVTDMQLINKQSYGMERE